MLFTSVYYFFYAKNFKDKSLSIFVMCCAILSPLIALSRGGLIFVVISFITVYLVHIFESHGLSKSRFKDIFFGVIISLVIILSAIYASKTVDSARWGNFRDKVSMGFEKIDPIDFYCRGIGVLENESLKKTGAIPQEDKLAIASVVDGDGARVMSFRAAIELIKENFLGIDQSKEAFQLALKKKCSNLPAVFISHAHNGWLDTALAIGVPGAFILSMLFIGYIRHGLIFSRSHYDSAPVGLCLAITSCIWFVRALFDSSLRDQMLETQAFTFAILFGMTSVQNLTPKKRK
jgi:O-antigen ligase